MSTLREFHGVIAYIDIPTMDGRKVTDLVLEEGANIPVQALGAPNRGMQSLPTVIGRVDEVSFVGPLVLARGRVHANAEAVLGCGIDLAEAGPRSKTINIGDRTIMQGFRLAGLMVYLPESGATSAWLGAAIAIGGPVK